MSLSGRFIVTYWGATEGPHVRIGGLITILFSFFGLWTFFKKKRGPSVKKDK